MLNFCIANIGNAFDAVKEERVIADQTEKIKVILEYENIMYRRPKQNSKKYLQIFKEKEFQDRKKIAELVIDVKEIILKNNEGLVKEMKEMDDKIGAVGDRMEEINR